MESILQLLQLQFTELVILMLHEDIFYCFIRAEKTSILSDLIRNTNAQEMKCIIMIILKGLIFFFVNA